MEVHVVHGGGELCVVAAAGTTHPCLATTGTYFFFFLLLHRYICSVSTISSPLCVHVVVSCGCGGDGGEIDVEYDSQTSADCGRDEIQWFVSLA